MRSSSYITAANLDERATVWLDEIRSRVPPRPQLQVAPARCALLIIDMLRYFAAPTGRCFLPATTAIVPRVAALLEAWRARGGEVVYTQHRHAGPNDLGMLGKFFSDYIRAGEPDAEILPALAPAPGELVLGKTTYDAFHGTPLADHLAGRGLDQVLVTGVLTHMCCETTARSAFCRGLEVFVAADAMASSSEERHVGSLLSMADAVAIVYRTGEILERCRASES